MSLEIRKIGVGEAKKVSALIQSVNLDGDVFIKSDEEHVKNLLRHKRSFGAYEGGEIVGVVLVLGWYVDTIVSVRRGVGQKLLKALDLLGCGMMFTAHISDKNAASIALFEKYGAKKVRDEKVDGFDRGLYAFNVRY